MDNIGNCADCGKRFGFAERIFSKTNGLWICEDCNIKQIQENDNKDQKIADLETKLAESNENVKLLAETRVDMCDTIKDLETQLAESEKSKESYRLQNDEHHLQLCQFYSRLGVEAFGADIHEKALETLMIMKEQLAEKDKEIVYMTKQAKKFNNEAQKYFEDAYCNDVIYQDKISFAVEQLEKVRKKFDCEDNYCYGDNNVNIVIKNTDFNKYIDQLIAEIKGDEV